VQHKVPGVTDPDLVWADVGKPAKLKLKTRVFPIPTSSWSGMVTLPASRTTTPTRLVLREWETWAADPTPTGKPVVGQRLVHVDTLVIS